MKKLRILALNPFHGGSHKAFLENWVKRSRHTFTILSLPDTQWRWRLHFAAVSFATQVKELYDNKERWDAVFCTSMMNVAEFRGLCPFIQELPLTVYFHENQLTYPESSNVKFSLDLCMANILSAYSADQVWFNSNFHKNDFLKAAAKLLRSKPENSIDIIPEIEKKSSVHYPGFDKEFFLKRKYSPSQPIKLVWASRWEEDKNPGLLFKTLRLLKEKHIDFKISILGEEMGTRMSCFEDAQKEFSKEIEHFGYAESKEDYMKILQKSDVFISTADHEFFGIAAVEAVASGCIPVVPEHLAYPEVLSEFKEFFYKPRSSVALVSLIQKVLSFYNNFNSDFVLRYEWGEVSCDLDAGIG